MSDIMQIIQTDPKRPPSLLVAESLLDKRRLEAIESKKYEAAYVTVDQYKWIDQAIINVLRERVISREVLTVTGPLGLGAQTISYDTLTDMSDAEISMRFREESEDAIALARGSLNVPILSKQFKIDRRDLASSRRAGTALDITTSIAAAAKVAAMENALIITGNTKYGISGLYNGAGTSETTANDFATFGKATTKLALMLDVLDQADVDAPNGYALLLNPTQLRQLQSSVSTTGVRELPTVRDQLGGVSASIVGTKRITAGTCLLMAKKMPEYYDLVVGQDAITELKEGVRTGDVYGMVFETIIPRIKQEDALCGGTGV